MMASIEQIVILINQKRQHGGVVVRTVTIVLEFALLAPVSVFFGYSGFLPQARNMTVRPTGGSRLTAGLNVNVPGCLSPLCL